MISISLQDKLNFNIKINFFGVFQVIPQLIARIDTRHLVGRLIQELLIDIGKQHPQVMPHFHLFILTFTLFIIYLLSSFVV